MYPFTASKCSIAKVVLPLTAIAVILPLQAGPSFAQSLNTVKQTRQQESSLSVQTSAVRRGQLNRGRVPVNQPHLPTGPVFGGNGCPEGMHLIMWDKPIYDEDGLFVVDYEPTPYCVDSDAEPAG